MGGTYGNEQNGDGLSMKTEYSKQAVKVISKMSISDERRIKQGIETLPEGDVKPLRGAPGSFRLRIGDWRIIFSHIEDGAILIDKIAPRGEIYKGGHIQ
ncbi:MAG: type II toxin-antitoxin system RelE/ParE family toxin [Clostridiales Family XIII bacterium]|jgi:mRNA interferase RelE/StbE|nr:type II toxin-antitoxin system RelE/ParE family toxin [Clostridiales Family XIII bacterium]